MERDDDHKKWGVKRRTVLEEEQFEWEPEANRREMEALVERSPEPEVAESLLSMWRSALDAMRDAVVRHEHGKDVDADGGEQEAPRWGSLRFASGMSN
jgi:hypothetical protein